MKPSDVYKIGAFENKTLGELDQYLSAKLDRIQHRLDSFDPAKSPNSLYQLQDTRRRIERSIMRSQDFRDELEKMFARLDSLRTVFPNASQIRPRRSK